MIKKCSNGRSLLVTNIESLCMDMETDWTPFVVLLTDWSVKAAKAGEISGLIKFLLVKGARNFVCIGECSESLHDKIDEMLDEYEDERNIIEPSEVITTYHDGESPDDAVNYFVHGTEIPEGKIGGLLALLGNEDQELEEILKNA